MQPAKHKLPASDKPGQMQSHPQTQQPETLTMKLATPYTPKAIRGQKVKGYTKVSTSQVARMFADGQTFDGFIVGNKVASWHFFNGWHLAFPIQKETQAEFSDCLQQWAWYNANSETGNTPAIYVRNK
jgi:hypothetical protein